MLGVTLPIIVLFEGVVLAVEIPKLYTRFQRK